MSAASTDFKARIARRFEIHVDVISFATAIKMYIFDI